MFGYVNVNGKDLSPENRKIYQSYYCGLCRALHEMCGTRGKIFLSYDMTFLVVLLTGLYEPMNIEERFVCRLHPLRKSYSRINEITRYAAGMNILLAYHNLMDDWEDEKNHASKFLAQGIREDYERMKEAYPRQAAAVETYMRDLAAMEGAKETNIDLVAGLTGVMLGEIFAWKEDEWYTELKNLGLYLGKFIYMMDAYEDMDRDSKKKNYNPLVTLKKEQEEDFETLCKLMMSSMMSECARSFERLPILMHGDILRNILYSGVWFRYDVLQLQKKRKKR